jgi:hypothetical protein
MKMRKIRRSGGTEARAAAAGRARGTGRAALRATRNVVGAVGAPAAGPTARAAPDWGSGRDDVEGHKGGIAQVPQLPKTLC